MIQETGGFVPAKVLTPGINDAKQVIREKMELFGSWERQNYTDKDGKKYDQFEFSNTTEIVFGKVRRNRLERKYEIQ